MGYPYQPPVPGYGAPYGPPTGYPAPKSKMRKGPALAAGVLGIVAGLVSVVNLLLFFGQVGLRIAHTETWIIVAIQAVVTVGLLVLGGICLSRRRVATWLLFCCAVLGMLLAPTEWILYGYSLPAYVRYFFESAVQNATNATWRVALCLMPVTAVVALVAALSREGAQWQGAPVQGQQYPPPGYPPYGRQY